MDLERALDLPPWLRYTLFGAVVVLVLVVGYIAMSPSGEPEAAPEGDTPAVVQPPAVKPTEGAPENATEVDQNPIEDVELALELPLTQSQMEVAAGEAVEFSELYAAYRFDQDGQRKIDALERYLAKENLVDLNGVLPTGSLAETLVSSKAVVDARATEVMSSLLSLSTVILNVTVETTTTSDDSEPMVRDHYYAVTLVRDGDNADWKVQSFGTQDDHDHAIQDEG